MGQAVDETAAWLVTSGGNCGVMEVVGRAMAKHWADQGLMRKRCVRRPLVGIGTWGTVQGRQHLEGGQSGQVSRLPPADTNSNDGVALEPNHTHFLLVDTKAEGRAAWGGAMALRAALVRVLGLRGSLRVLLVLQGGPRSKSRS